MATKLVSVVTGGSNSHQTSSAEINGIATDFISEGVVGAISATSGVAPTTGAFAVNQIGTPTMDVRVTNGVAYVTATPTGGSEQTFRVTMDATEDVTIAANATGGTRYDWIYIKLDADKLVNPAVDASDVATLTTSRSTSASTDNGTPPTYGYCIAVVTVANGASSITNANITDARTRTGANAFNGTNTIPAAALATNAIKLGYAAVTSITGFSSTASAQQISGLTTTVTIPAGGRSVKITAYVPNVSDATTGRTLVLSIWDGVVASGTQLAAQTKFVNNAGETTGMTAIAIVTPSAGSKTYNVGITDQSTGVLAFNAGGAGISSTNPAFILVEAI